MAFSGPSPSAYTEQLLGRAEDNLVARREADAEQLVIAREWALAHAVSAADVAREGVTHTRELGAIAMRVWEYAAAELAFAWQTHPLAAQKLMADALDLASRMPLAWASVLDAGMPAWVGRKLAQLTRDLPTPHTRLVDQQLADAYKALSPGRLLSAAEGRIAAADPTALENRVTKARHHHDVHTGRPLDGTATLYAHLDAVDAARLEQACDSIADLLEESEDDPTDRPTRSQLRARALGILADPQAALDLLHGRDPRRGKAVVYVHVTPKMLESSGIARVEDLGPHSKKMLAELLGHDRITVRPVLDLNDQSPASDCYEIPTQIAERIHLIKPADVFPWAESTSRGADLDHTLPWPLGSTETANLGKLVRRHHRIKTHARGWKVRQLPGHRYLWQTPHGRGALVDRFGTHPLDTGQARSTAKVP